MIKVKIFELLLPQIGCFTLIIFLRMRLVQVDMLYREKGLFFILFFLFFFGNFGTNLVTTF